MRQNSRDFTSRSETRKKSLSGVYAAKALRCRDINSAAYAAARCCWCTVEMATAQRTRPRAVVGAPRRAAWQLKSTTLHYVTASAQRKKFFYIFFTIIVGDFLFMNNNG